MPKPAAPKPINVLVFIHGMVPDRYAKTWEPTYERFRDGLDFYDHRITNSFDSPRTVPAMSTTWRRSRCSRSALTIALASVIAA